MQTKRVEAKKWHVSKQLKTSTLTQSWACPPANSPRQFTPYLDVIPQRQRLAIIIIYRLEPEKQTNMRSKTILSVAHGANVHTIRLNEPQIYTI